MVYVCVCVLGGGASGRKSKIVGALVVYHALAVERFRRVCLLFCVCRCCPVQIPPGRVCKWSVEVLRSSRVKERGVAEGLRVFKQSSRAFRGVCVCVCVWVGVLPSRTKVSHTPFWRRRAERGVKVSLSSLQAEGTAFVREFS